MVSYIEEVHYWLEEVGYLNGCAFVEPEDFDAAQMTIIEQLTALICVLNPQKIVIQV